MSAPGEQRTEKNRLARQIKQLRKARGLTQRQLAAKVGTSRSVIARLEQAATFPTVKTLYRIGAALEVEVSFGLGDPEEAGEGPVAMQKRPAGGPRINVLVADAQQLFAEALATGLAQHPDLEVHYVRPKTLLTTGLDAAQAAARSKPDVALLDFWMDEMAGPALTRAVLAWAPGVRVLIMSWFHGPRDVQAALDAGAAGFLPKSLSVGEVAEAIRRTNQGESLVYADQVHGMVEAISERDRQAKDLWELIGKLTPREVDVVRMLATGRALRDVAKQMGIAQGTLRIHINKIISKLEAESRMQAVAIARRAGLVH